MTRKTRPKFHQEQTSVRISLPKMGPLKVHPINLTDYQFGEMLEVYHRYRTKI